MIDKILRGRILTALAAIIGLLIIFYPNISDAWNTRRSQMLMTSYEETIGQIDDSKKEEILQNAYDYNKTLIGKGVPDIFIKEEREPDPAYESLLNPSGDGVMGSVEIPCIRVKIPIWHYTDEETLQKGAGHLPGSSLPVGGEGSHSVITAHRGLQDKRLFTDLDRVKKGNLFYLRIMDETLAYEADQILVVEPTETDALSVEEDKDYCTLLTCTPYAVNTQRLLVRGHRVPYTEETYQAETAAIAPPSASSVLIRLLCVLIGLALAVGVDFGYRKLRR